MASSPDYAILSAPRITAAGFAAVLQAAGSPAAPEAAACYQAFVDAGVDPAVGLAVFRKESTFGKFGRANANRSWGNIRGAGGYPTDSGGFRIYPSWTSGALDAARLLAVYGRNAIRPGTKTDTVQTFPYVWAPSADGNAPDAYGDQLAAWIGEWHAEYMASSRTYRATVTKTTRLWNDRTKRWVYTLAPGRILSVRGARYTKGGVSCYPVNGPYPWAGGTYYVPAANVRLS